jgi:hypothetical protein
MTRVSGMGAVERPWMLHVEHPTPEVARVEPTGAWRKEERLPDASEVWCEIQEGPPVHRLIFDTSRVTDWDSGLVAFARNVLEEARARGIEGDRAGLPDGNPAPPAPRGSGSREADRPSPIAAPPGW